MCLRAPPLNAGGQNPSTLVTMYGLLDFALKPGESGQSALLPAFRRWCEQTPLRYRRALPAGTHHC